MEYSHDLASSFRVAFSGIKHTLRERNMRIHFGFALWVIVAGVWFELALWEWCALFLAIGVVLCAELFNTAIEELANVVRDQGKLSREATKLPRDIAAGAVLAASISSVAIGLLIFLPKIFA